MVLILFRCDGGPTPEIGTGHVARCTRLAQDLEKQGGIEIGFLMQDNLFTNHFSQSHPNWSVHLFPGNALDKARAILAKLKPDILVVDRLDTDPVFMEMAKPHCQVLISLDDLGPGSALSDLVINGIVGGSNTPYSGPAYVITPADLDGLKAIQPECKNIFVSFGGYDHLNLTLKAAQALEHLDPSQEVHLVVGAAYPAMDELRAFVSKARRPFTVHPTPSDYLRLLRQADVALVSGGLTLFETMAAGVPTLVLAQYGHQAATAKKFQKEGATELLGTGDAVSIPRIRESIERLIRDHALRLRMSRKAQGLVDGEGLRRVSDMLRLVKPLPWDSDFFGIPIAAVTPSRLNERTAEFIDQWAKKQGIRCLYYLCDCNHAQSVRIAEAHGYHFTDIRVTFRLDTEGYQPRPGSASVRECQEQDLPAIQAIAKSSYLQSRYYFDGHFATPMLERFYSDWLENTFRSSGGKIFIAVPNGRPVGYISGEIGNRGRLGRIVLVGVAESESGQGLGKRLVDAMLDWMHEQRVYAVEVVTQGRNIRAQQLYQKSGFKITSLHLWYHKWFE